MAKKSKPNEKIVRLRIICVKPPDFSNAEFGIQDKGRVVHQVLPNENGDTRYDIEIRAKWDETRKRVSFLGPWTHGPADQRFLYLSWCEPDLPPDTFTRRMKIRLTPITWEQIGKAEQTGGVLEVAVPGTGRDGGLRCGSVELLDKRWVAQEIRSYQPIQPTE